MSASKAIASAKNKKAGLNSPNPATPIPDQQNNTTDVRQQPATKLTIPQALQMIMKRLDIVEERMNELDSSFQETRAFGQQTENKYLVDAKVFDSLVTRLDNLENNKEPLRNIEDNKQVESLEKSVAHIQNGITDFKNDFVKLQSYVMDTNAKLTDVVFSIPTECMVEYREIFAKRTNEDIKQKEDANSEIQTRDVSVPDINELSKIDLASVGLEPPVLKRQTNEIFTPDDINVTNINDIFPDKNNNTELSSDV
tara:strand:+ start:484 stop:1245 length:762 start_codon:yes stop_codon:yes gene_type:complete